MKKDTNQQVLVEEFDEEDWADLMKKPPTGLSWSEESFLADDEYRETDKEYSRCN